MNLDSVRALKADVAERAARPLFEDGTFAMAFSTFGSTSSSFAPPPVDLALGIARGVRSDDFRLAVRLHRRSPRSLRYLDRVIPTAARADIDLRFTGPITIQTPPWQRARHRPLVIGCSVGHHAVTAGTLGAVVHAAGSREPLILGNNHVLANEDRAAIGDDVVQPGSLDGGRRPTDVVGNLAASIRLKRTGNLVDAATASLTEAADATLLTGLGTLRGLRADPIEPGDRVSKLGRTTGLTHGIVTAIELDDVVVGFDRGERSFDRQIEIEGTGAHAFSAGGDSGSLIVDERLFGCGLLFAGGDTGGSNGKGLTYANDLGTVLQQLNVLLAV